MWAGGWASRLSGMRELSGEGEGWYGLHLPRFSFTSTAAKRPAPMLQHQDTLWPYAC